MSLDLALMKGLGQSPLFAISVNETGQSSRIASPACRSVYAVRVRIVAGSDSPMESA
jgi:hypothetical protein